MILLEVSVSCFTLFSHELLCRSQEVQTQTIDGPSPPSLFCAAVTLVFKPHRCTLSYFDEKHHCVHSDIQAGDKDGNIRVQKTSGEMKKKIWKKKEEQNISNH